MTGKHNPRFPICPLGDFEWWPIDVLVWAKSCKEQRLSLFCRTCDAVLIDSIGRRRTKEPIWAYGVPGGTTLGYAHQGCSYGVEIAMADARDPNWGKPPPEWT